MPSSLFQPLPLYMHCLPCLFYFIALDRFLDSDEPSSSASAHRHVNDQFPWLSCWPAQTLHWPTKSTTWATPSLPLLLSCYFVAGSPPTYPDKGEPLVAMFPETPTLPILYQTVLLSHNTPPASSPGFQSLQRAVCVHNSQECCHLPCQYGNHCRYST